MRTYLNVPYDQKEKAKKAGARWDPLLKKWYAEDLEDLRGLLRYMPEHLTRRHEPKGTK